MKAPGPRRLEAAMSAAMQIKATLPDDDDQLLRDTLEGQTDVFELMDRLAEQAIADKLLVDKATERARRLERRADKRRDIIARMLECLELGEALERPMYTATLAHVRTVIVNDETELPAEFFKHAPDKIRIGKALRDGKEVKGATLSNPRPSLSLLIR